MLKTKNIEVVIHYPSTNRQNTMRWAGSADSIFKTKEKEVQLHAGMMSYDESKKRAVAHIDGEKWLQIRTGGAYSWVGPDPKMQMAARVREIRRNLQTRGLDFSKYVWPVVIFVLGIMAALIAMPLVITQMGA